ncbi:MAG: class I SAM-dependent methyltransferase [Candidatus Pelagadaptatus aseana]|uniref:class I SAM-dependent methyltransferase n=1 Tax=Candidatus Pelagadaptatus aseana TaxID=3120508 RepID=UPI0039B301C5
MNLRQLMGLGIFLTAFTAVADDNRLQTVLASQTPEVQSRYPYRHPQQTLEFFDVKPEMTVVEVLPGRGWYSKILMAYLGPEGHLIGADYSIDLLRNFSFFSEQMLQNKLNWTSQWPKKARSWVADGAEVSGFQFGSMPAELNSTADRVLFIRAMHNLNRFDPAYLKAALAESFMALKSGGILGIVQHQASETKSDEWANGSRGYLKQSYVIEQAELAGFTFIEASDINHNAQDQPGADEVVWRLPPSLRGSKDNPEYRAKMIAIGESNRMTLKFSKP